MQVRATVSSAKVTHEEVFSNARHARAFVLGHAKVLGARWEGNGSEGSLFTGRGSGKKVVAYYWIELV